MKIKVREGYTLAAPDGSLIAAGQVVEVPEHEVEFFVRMGAADVVPDAPAPAAPAEKPAKKAKGG